MERSEPTRGIVVRSVAALAILVVGVAAVGTPAHAQAVVVGTKCVGERGTVTVQINTATADLYRVFIDGQSIADNLSSGADPIEISPIVNGSHEVRVDLVRGGTLAVTDVVVNCAPAVTATTFVKPVGGVATGGGGTAGGTGIPWVIVGAGLVASVAGAVLLRARLAT